MGSNSGTIKNVYASSTVHGTTGVGGLVGINSGTVKFAYATGATNGTSNVGGLVGLSSSAGSIINGYYDSGSTGRAHGTQGDGSIGLTTQEWLTQGPIATGVFDTAATWVAGYAYPVLKTLPYVLVTADGSEVYGSSTPTVTVSSVVDETGGDGTSFYGGNTNWISNAADNVGTGYVLGGLGGTVSAGYQLTYSGTLTITPAPLTITANDDSKTYDGQAYGGGNGVTYTGFVNGESSSVLSGTLDYGGSARGAINAGSYAITPNGLTSSNYTITFVDGTLTVNPAPLTITANDDSKTYNGQAYGGGNGVTYSGFVNGEGSAVLSGALGYGGSAQGAVNAGSYAITPNGLTSSNYTISFVDGTLTVNPAPLTITANDDSKTYNGLAYSGGNGVTYSGFVNGEGSAVLSGALGYGGSAQGAVNAGSYAITPNGLTSSNYTISFVDGTLMVNPAPLMITANDDSKTYDGQAYGGGNGVSYAGFVNGESNAVLGGTLGYGGSAQGAVNAGSYVITPGGLTSSNYAISFINGALTVNKAALTVAANDDSQDL